MHHGQSRGGNEIYIKYVKAGEFFENKREIFQSRGKIVIFAKPEGNVLKQGK